MIRIVFVEVVVGDELTFSGVGGFHIGIGRIVEWLEEFHPEEITVLRGGEQELPALAVLCRHRSLSAISADEHVLVIGVWKDAAENAGHIPEGRAVILRTTEEGA